MGWSRDTLRKVAKRTGYPVVESWSSYNMGSMGTPIGAMLHHTGMPNSAPGDYPTLRTVRDGRVPDLMNSLCAFGLGRSGTIYLISEKLSWHAGAGSWRGVSDGNGRFLGIEAEGPPVGAWPTKQMDSYKKLVASILMECRSGSEWAVAHKEWAPTRKIDPSGISMNAFRADVQKILNNPALLGKGGVDAPVTNAEMDAVAKKVVALLEREVGPLRHAERIVGDMATREMADDAGLESKLNSVISQLATLKAQLDKLAAK